VEIEKVYMREMNHRVKNNLAMIDSLLGLELARLSEHPDGADEVLRKVKGRIQAVGQVHEMLIGVSDREMVDTSEYLKTLAESLFNTDSRSRGQISVEYSLEDGLRFPVGTAIAQGMIMTELIINALKYAFPYDPRGKVRIAFGSSPGDRCFLSVGDDGIPLPPHWEEKGSGNIGMDLISVLVKQLNGDFLIEQKDDFKNFTVTFPAAHVSAG